MKPFRERNPIVVGIVCVAVLSAAMLFAFSLNRLTFLRGVYVIQADFADAAGLNPNNEVRVAGLRVGKVQSIELAEPDAQGVSDRVRVTMEVSSGIDLGNESEAEIKLKTILGQKFVDLVPKGGAPYVRVDDVIGLERTRIPFEFYEVTNRAVETLGQIDAQALNDALRELGTLFDDPEGNLGRALDGLSRATDGLVDRDVELEQLVRDGAEILEVLGSRSEALGRIFESGADLLGALAARSDGLRRFVRSSDHLARELSDLLRATRSDLDPALAALHEALVVVRANLEPLDVALEALGPSAKSFAQTTTQGRWVDIWIQSILDLPIPPLAPGGTAMGTAAASADHRALAAVMLGDAS